MREFFQDAPTLTNTFRGDPLLSSYLRRVMGEAAFAELAPGLERLGERAVTDILALGEMAEDQPPKHVPFDAWGRRVDRIDVSPGWTALDRVSAEEGLVATGYERRRGGLSRLDQFARLYLFSPSSAIYSCPLAMTDGAARCIELYGDEWLRERAYARLTSRDPERFWTSGQWMTERTGGSDVSETTTVARRDPSAPGGWRLWGTKWFTSATTSQMAMTLARVEDEDGRVVEGSRGLSLFYLELRDEGGALQGIRVERLKDKLGTRALPTAELALEGTPARLVGGEGHGVRKIASLFNVTRVYNAVAAVAGMRRALDLARDYARKRVAFGKPLAEHPLHVETLAAIEVEWAAAFHLVFHVVQLMGRDECGEATDDERAILRLLTPVAKLYTGKQAVAVASEAVESFGGAGYIEDTRLPVLLRDAQVLAIWEGTTNVLSLDVLRALERERAWGPLAADLERRLDGVRAPVLHDEADRARTAVRRIGAFLRAMATEERARQEAEARALAFALARTTAAVLMIEHADWALAHGSELEAQRAAAAASRWSRAELVPVVDAADAAWRADSTALVGVEEPRVRRQEPGGWSQEPAREAGIAR